MHSAIKTKHAFLSKDIQMGPKLLAMVLLASRYYAVAHLTEKCTNSQINSYR